MTQQSFFYPFYLLYTEKQGATNSMISSNIQNSQADSELCHVFIFDESKIFWLENLGEGGFGSVRKAYNKRKNEFIAVKTFKNLEKLPPKMYNKIILEEARLLQSIEKIRLMKIDNYQYFLKFYGLYRNSAKTNTLILNMESGIATLEDVLRAGKKYPLSELLYVIKRITEALFLLEENGIANRDVKPSNIILVDNPFQENRYYYKISDFGLGCKLEKGVCTVELEGLLGCTEEYAAPEVRKFCKKAINHKGDIYNPFLSDVFSLGVLTMQIIDKKWGKKDRNFFRKKKKFVGYESIIDLLKGMLEENPEKRWSFRRILDFLHMMEKNKFIIETPKDEKLCWQRCRLEKENKIEQNFQNFEKLLKEHQKMYSVYENQVTRPQESKFHLDRCWEILGKMEEILNENDSQEKFKKIKENRILLSLQYGNWFSTIGELRFSEENLNFSKTKIQELNQESYKNDIKFKIINAVLWNNLACLRLKEGNVRKANELYLISLKIYENVYSENHPKVATSLANLGNLYDNIGDYKKAKMFSLKSLKIRQRCYVSNHPDVANSLNQLGALYQKTGNLVKANELYSKSLKIYQNLYGEIHPHVALSLNNLGALNENMGNLSKAEECYLKSLKIFETIFGENHHYVALTLSNLGTLYDNESNIIKAEEYLMKSLIIRQKLYDENHPEFATSLNNLGKLYISMCNFPKAKTFFSKALKIFENIFGEDHQSVATLLNNIGNLHEKVGDLARAKNFYFKSLKIKQTLYAENHPDFQLSLNNLRSLYYKMGNLPKAKRFYLKSLGICQRILGKNHPDVATAIDNLGNLYQKIGHSSKAERLYLKSFKIQNYHFGINHKSKAISCNNLGVLYESMDNLPKAKAYFLKSLEIFQNFQIENDWDFAMSLNNLGAVCKKMGKFTEAEGLFLQALKIYQNIFGENHQNVATLLNNLGFLYNSLGNLQKAKKLHLKSLKISQRLDRENNHYKI